MMKRFPIGFWNTIDASKVDASYVKDWADAGMTLAMTPDFDPQKHDKKSFLAILNAAAKAGIAVIVCDARTHWRRLEGGEAAYRAGFKKALADFGKHKAVVGFFVGDEPDGTQLANAYAAMRIQKELAPKLMPYLNHLPWYPGVEPRLGFHDFQAFLADYVERARPDVISYDCYSQMRDDLDLYFRNLRHFEQASRRAGLPFWNIILSAGHWLYRCPTEEDLRWQLSTSVAHGAKGILWYCFRLAGLHGNYRLLPIDEHGQRTETFAWLSRVNRTFLRMHAETLLDLTLVKAMHAGAVYGGWDAFAADDLVIDVKSEQNLPLIVSRFSDSKGRPYVMLVNNHRRESQRTHLLVRGRRPAVFHVGWEGESQLPTTGEFHCQLEDSFQLTPYLAPGQMELFRVGQS